MLVANACYILYAAADTATHLAWSPASDDVLAVSTLRGALIVTVSEASSSQGSPLEVDPERLPEGSRLLETGAAVTALAFSPDGQWLAAGTENGQVCAIESTALDAAIM